MNPVFILPSILFILVNHGRKPTARQSGAGS
jgi:hypothetical protein